MIKPTEQAMTEKEFLEKFHEAWAHAKDNSSKCTDGYDKNAFMHVQWWMHEHFKSLKEPESN